MFDSTLLLQCILSVLAFRLPDQAAHSLVPRCTHENKTACRYSCYGDHGAHSIWRNFPVDGDYFFSNMYAKIVTPEGEVHIPPHQRKTYVVLS